MVPHVAARKTHQRLLKFSFVTPKRLLQQYRPETDTCATATASLFDDLIGACENTWWDFEAERLCGFEVDDEEELGRLLVRDFARLSSAQDLIDLPGRAAIDFGELDAVGHQPTGRDELRIRVHRRQAGRRCQLGDKPA